MISESPVKKLVVAVCGSIAAYKACELVRNLSKADFPVRVLMTRNAERFIGRITFETLSEREVYTDNWELGMVHMEIKHEAAVFAVIPATANIIGKFANGIADDVVSSSYLAANCPVVVAPAMNPGMYASRPLQRNLKQLRDDGVELIDPAEGLAADGEFGTGKLADIAPIEARLKEIYLREINSHQTK